MTRPEMAPDDPATARASGAGAAPRGRLDALLDGLAALCMGLAGAMMVTLVAIMGWLVFGRYALNDTPTWVEQVSLLLVVWITFLGAAVAVHRGAHLSVEFVRDAAPVPVRAALRIAADLIVLVFGALMAWQGLLLSQSNLGRAVPMLGVSEAWRSAPLVACGALIAVFAAARLAGGLRRRPRPGDMRARG